MNGGAHGLSGLRLLRARPGALAATALLTVALTLSHNWVWLRGNPWSGMGGGLTQFLILPLVVVLATIVPLIAVAAISGRRVTVGRALLLWVVTALLSIAKGVVFLGVSFASPGALGGVQPVFEAVSIVVLIVTGLLARWLLPMPGCPVVSGRDALPLILASVLVMLVPLPQMYDEMRLVLAGALWGLFLAGWAVAALVTSIPRSAESAGVPAESGGQDPR